MSKIHRPIITRHTVHCLCGVFCGASPDRWFDHAEDVHVLHPADLVDMTPISETAAAWRRAGDRATKALREFARAFNPARRSLTRDSIAILNRPVIPNPTSTDILHRITLTIQGDNG